MIRVVVVMVATLVMCGVAGLLGYAGAAISQRRRERGRS